MSLQPSIPAQQFSPAPPVWSGSGPDYLECVQALADEIALAMNAIASDELCIFEESVSRQRTLSMQLKMLTVSAASTTRAGLAQSEESFNLDLRIGDALGRLQSLNRRYAALIKQSSEMAKMLTRLLQPSSAYMRGGEVAPANYSTWSCQL